MELKYNIVQRLSAPVKPDLLVCKDVTLIREFLSAEECDAIITLTTTHGMNRLATRNRLMFTSSELAQWMWKRLQPVMPYPTYTDEYKDEWKAVGLNERFRMARYDPSDEFSIHEDGYYQSAHDLRSFATAMVYLNEVPVENGGSTHFPHFGLRIQPQEGLGCVFLVEDMLHCGEKLKAGVKYLLRTDIMYQCTRMAKPNIRQQIYDLRELAYEYETAGDDARESQTWDKIFKLELELK